MNAGDFSPKGLKPTSLTYLRMVNYRMFKKVNIELHPGLCVFLGNNGSGKTSVLDAISFLISSIFSLCDYVPKIRSLAYELRNVRAHMEYKRGKSRLIREDVSGVVGTLTRYRKMESAEKISNVRLSVGRKLSAQQDLCIDSTIRQLATEFNERVRVDSSIPTFAHYGSHRGAEQGDRKRFARRKIDYTNPFAAYINALHPSLDFDAFLEWFSEEEAAELRMQRKNKAYKSAELNAVRTAIVRVFETSDIKVKEPRFEDKPKRFVLTKVQPNGDELELEFDQLSDGYRAMIALVADYARRLAIANQYSSQNPLEGEGILLIDEIDAHLHPKWQYRVIDDLRRTFPNVQLIVTTHSAEVVSTVSRESVYILDTEDGEVTVTHPIEQTKGDYPEYIGGTAMGIPDNMWNHSEFQAYMNCLGCIKEDDTESEFFKEQRKQVIEAYGENHHFVREIAARLNGLERKKSVIAKLKDKKQ